MVTPGDKRHRILAMVRRIPAGQVSTYGDIAHFAGLGRHARLVGYALHNSPANVPWHRVVNAKGRISLAAGSTAALTQRRRLVSEGITFLGGQIDLQHVRWAGPDNSDAS